MPSQRHPGKGAVCLTVALWTHGLPEKQCPLLWAERAQCQDVEEAFCLLWSLAMLINMQLTIVDSLMSKAEVQFTYGPIQFGVFVSSKTLRKLKQANS